MFIKELKSKQKNEDIIQYLLENKFYCNNEFYGFDRDTSNKSLENQKGLLNRCMRTQEFSERYNPKSDLMEII